MQIVGMPGFVVKYYISLDKECAESDKCRKYLITEPVARSIFVY